MSLDFTPRADDAKRAQQYCADGSWTDETLGTILAAGFADAPDNVASFRSDVRPWRGTYAEASDDCLRPAPAEIGANPRSRPAKFRWAKKGA